VPLIFPAIQTAAHVADAEMYRVFNMGIGIVLIIAPEHVNDVRSLMPEAVVIGEIIPRGDGGAVRIDGVLY
jgi:phosphoribosylformylglycinamidine cyclo-ligase